MSKSQKRLQRQLEQFAKREALRAKAVRTFNLAMSMNRPLDAEQTTTLGVAYWAAFDAVKRGAATDHDIDTLASAVNVSLILCERTPGSEDAIDAVKSAQDALMRAKGRHDRHGRYGLDGAGMQALADALDIHDQQMRLHTAGEMESALVEAIKRMRAGDVLEVA